MGRTSGEEDLEAAFRTFLQQVRLVTEARYAALSIFGDDEEIAKFFTLGLTEEQREQVGGLPEGEGLLGYIHEEQEMLHLDDMGRHSESVGFPDGHPPMQSLLAAPITYQSRPLGNLYLTDKKDVITFSDADAQFVESASEAAAVLINEKESRIENQRMRQRLRHETEAIVSVLDRLADGDLPVDIPQNSDDEDIARVWDRLHETVDTLRRLLRQVAEASQEMSRASDEISATSDEISTGAEEQSMQMEEEASAIEEIAVATEGQSTTSEQVSQSINEISTVTAENTRGVTEIAQSTSDLSGLSNQLVETVDQFTLEADDDRASRSRHDSPHPEAERPAAEPVPPDSA
jgi:Methyl-accepting chemotaxis protein